MAATALEICQAVADVVGMKAINSLIGNPEAHAKAMLRLLNRGGRVLSAERDAWGAGWVVLTREWQFQTVVGQEEYAVPEDFQQLVDRTVWDRSTYREARGAMSPAQWQTHRSGLVESVTIAPNYRLRRNTAGTGRAIWLDPVPSTQDTLVLEYVSDAWVLSADGTTVRNEVQQDTDRILFDTSLMEMDLEWRFKKSRGLSYVDDLAECEQEKNRLLGRDAGPQAIHLGQQPAIDRLTLLTPDTGYGGV